MLALIDSETGLIALVIAVLVLFGGSRLPKLFRSLGSAQAEYKKGLAEGQAAAAPATPTEQSAPVAPAAVPRSPGEAPGVLADGLAPAAPPASPAPDQPQPGA